MRLLFKSNKLYHGKTKKSTLVLFEKFLLKIDVKYRKMRIFAAVRAERADKKSQNIQLSEIAELTLREGEKT